MRRAVAVMIALWCGVVAPAGAAIEPDPRLTPRERSDLLEPWSLEPGRLPAALPAPSPGRPEPAPAPGAEPGETTATPETPVGVDGAQAVDIVRCRQLELSQPARAERLAAFLRSGADLETARRAVGGVDVVERTRDYALADLEPEIRAEIAALPIGGWSRVRTSRGRATLYQVVAKERRAAASLPQLGAGLGRDELSRLQARLQQRPAPARRTVVDEKSGVDAATVVKQEPPVYPANATVSGEVTVLVRVGRADDVVDVEVSRSSNPIFNDAALRAARISTYRSARRDGIPESDVVYITFNFVAPQTPPPPPPPASGTGPH